MFNFIIKDTKKNEIQEFPISFEIIDFCVVGEKVYFLHKNGIGLFENSHFDLNFKRKLMFSKIMELPSLSSITYNKISDSLYIVAEGGSRLYRIHTVLNTFEPLISDTNAKIIKKKYLKTENSKTYVSAHHGTVVWSVKDSHRMFYYRQNNAVPLIGNGKGGFSISKLNNSKICHPCGIDIAGQMICFADYGNNCIRSIKDSKVSTIISDCENVEDIYVINQRMYLLANNTVHLLSTEGDSAHLFEVYKVKNKILAFQPTDSGKVYILEKNDGKEENK